MIKTPLSTVIGGTFWTPGATIIGSTSATFNQLIKSLFSDGTQGIYLNAQDALSVSDLSSIKDLSGNNNHALQANSTSRASLITDPSGYKSLKFDGIDDGYVTQSIDFSKTDKVTVIAAVLVSSGVAGAIAELSTSITNLGSFTMLSSSGGNNDYSVGSNLGTYRTQASISSYSKPDKAVLAMSNYNNNIQNITLRRNGVLVGSNTASQGTGNYGNYPLYIGRRGGASVPFNGQIYALLVIGKLLDDATTQRIEKEFAKYIGVTL